MRLIDIDEFKRNMQEEENKLTEEFLRICSKLNEKGLKKILEYTEMLLRMPEYRKNGEEICSLLDKQPTYNVDKLNEYVYNKIFMESFTEVIDEGVKTEDFEAALNIFHCEVAKIIGAKVAKRVETKIKLLKQNMKLNND